MAKDLKYPLRRTARFSEVTDTDLVDQAKKTGVKPAILIRVLVEHGLKLMKKESDKS